MSHGKLMYFDPQEIEVDRFITLPSLGEYLEMLSVHSLLEVSLSNQFHLILKSGQISNTLSRVPFLPALLPLYLTLTS